MIEVVLAVVIIGLCVGSLPAIISANQKSNKHSLYQESIYSLVAAHNAVAGYAWDEKSAILRVDGASSEWDNSERFYDFVNIYGNSADRSSEALVNSASNIGKESGETDSHKYDDVDDWDNEDLSLTLSNNSANDELEENYKDFKLRENKIHIQVHYMQESVRYTDDNTHLIIDLDANPSSNGNKGDTSAQSTNIKRVRTTLKGDSDTASIKLDSFLFNIGSFN